MQGNETRSTSRVRSMHKSGHKLLLVAHASHPTYTIFEAESVQDVAIIHALYSEPERSDFYAAELRQKFPLLRRLRFPYLLGGAYGREDIDDGEPIFQPSYYKDFVKVWGPSLHNETAIKKAFGQLLSTARHDGRVSHFLGGLMINYRRWKKEELDCHIGPEVEIEISHELALFDDWPDDDEDPETRHPSIGITMKSTTPGRYKMLEIKQYDGIGKLVRPVEHCTVDPEMSDRITEMLDAAAARMTGS